MVSHVEDGAASDRSIGGFAATHRLDGLASTCLRTDWGQCKNSGLLDKATQLPGRQNPSLNLKVDNNGSVQVPREVPCYF